jgi:hypothetical protein
MPAAGCFIIGRVYKVLENNFVLDHEWDTLSVHISFLGTIRYQWGNRHPCS